MDPVPLFLMGRNPAAHERDLAAALSNFAHGLTKIGRRGEALTAIQDAVPIWRRLAAQNPDYSSSLATSLSNLSNRLAEVGRRDEALTAIKRPSRCTAGWPPCTPPTNPTSRCR